MILDMKTVMLMYVLINAICALVMAFVWHQNHERFAGLSFWLADMILQAVGALLIVLRGLVPDFISYVLANVALQAGVLLIYMGLERFVGKKSSQVHNYILLAIFTSIYIYYTYVQPDLAVRNIDIAALTLILTFQCCWLLVRRVTRDMRPITRVVGIVFGVYAVISAVRIILYLVYPPANSDFFKSGLLDTLLIMLYIVLAIGLISSLILMINRRMVREIQVYSSELETKSKLLNETGTMAKVGGWEFDPKTLMQTWTSEVYRIHEVDMDYQPNVEKGLSFYAPEAFPTISEASQRAIDYGEPFNMELPFITAKGKHLWVHAIGKAHRKDGKTIKVSGTFQDITERKQAEEALRESEERFRVAQEMSPDGFTILHPLRNEEGEIIDFTWVYENKTIARINGTDPEEVKGKRLLDLFPTHKGTSALEAYIDVSNSGKLQIMEEVYVREIVSRPTCLRLVIVSMGEDIAILAQDITDRKRTEDAMRQSENRYRSILEDMQESYFEGDLKGNAIFVNDAACSMLGYPRDKLLGINFRELVTREEARKWFEIFNNVYCTGEPARDFLWESMGKDGSTGYWLVSVFSKYNENGKIDGFRVLARDISDQRRAEKEIEAMSRFPNENPSPTLRVADDGIIIYANKASQPILSMWGRVVGQPLPEHDRQILFEAVGSNLIKEIEIKCGKRSFSFRVVPVIDKGYANMYGRDVTDSKTLEEQLNFSRQQLRNLSAHLQSSLEEIKTNLSHEIHDELGQALTALKLDLNWLSRRLPKKEEKGTLEKIESMAELIDTTTETMRRLCTELRPGLLDDIGLPAAIEWLLSQFRKRTTIKSQFILEPKEIDLNNDLSTAIFRIVQEALTNVARHSQATRVTISLMEKDGMVKLTVRDNGIGMTNNLISEQKSLGLLGIRERVFSLGGRIKIESTPGKGTTIGVHLPTKGHHDKDTGS